jgi:hypothetical protein
MEEGLKMKPVVVVIENPQEDPDVYSYGEVDIIHLSTYPMSKWGRDEVLDYGQEYADKLEYTRDRFPVGSGPWLGLNEMLTDFSDLLDKALDEDPDCG